MTEETLTVNVLRRTLNLIVKTLDLSLMAVYSQDEKPLQTKIPRRLLRGALITSN
ncbi:MAG: hypothetical protein KKB91_10425 [Proteobacteria bacterium]|jgi:hypothetical protein|nr:hypothetical protein [Pseudomonadota bacterium]MCG2744701.1 hypothetical protein [Desulfobacteraceae bacterium]MBU3982776.1 hypothetical protein [Pseudomonadota bacterium]MBU4030036.1 hypothetical protein [Pseudomonadota bacterium]MBU4041903.1 hypothetical protein [Pseudomonadota bacterium]